MPAGANLTFDQLAQIIAQLRPDSSRNPKVEDPELFYGQRSKLRAFVTQCELKFNCELNLFDTDAKKVHYASSRCRGDAWAWVEPSLKGGISTYTTWEGLKTALIKAFGEADSREVARRKLKGLKQASRSASAYWAEFQRITADLDYNDATYIDHFHDGLHIDVQRQLALMDERPSTLVDFANKAIALDNRLYNFRTLRPRNEPQFWDHQAQRQPTPQPQAANEYRLPDPDPMELDATRRFRYSGPIDMDKRKKNGSCFNCGRMGHYSANCPSRNMNRPRRPFRAAEVTYEEEEEQQNESGKERPQE
jgi:hypothetical protein